MSGQAGKYLCGCLIELPYCLPTRNPGLVHDSFCFLLTTFLFQLPENRERFEVKLVSATGGASLDPKVKAIINTTPVTIEIAENDAPIRFAKVSFATVHGISSS